ncbi:MAG: PepSY domain-containing protein [Anaerolineaceae bacterium]|nr:PepSY domain-containing protein [Anaerolineaceae bacterium]
MKINKFLALAVIAMMAIGVMGFVNTKVHAQSGTQPAPQAQVTEAPDNEQAVGPDTDNVEEQVGDQNAQDTTADSANEPVEAKGSDGQDAAPTGTPSISSDAALLAAQAYMRTTAAGTATLDDENGMLVYSVDLNGSDVKVDAMTGTVLGVDQVGDGQFEGGN